MRNASLMPEPSSLDPSSIYVSVEQLSCLSLSLSIAPSLDSSVSSFVGRAGISNYVSQLRAINRSSSLDFPVAISETGWKGPQANESMKVLLAPHIFALQHHSETSVKSTCIVCSLQSNTRHTRKARREFETLDLFSSCCKPKNPKNSTESLRCVVTSRSVLLRQK